jgi:hypothetical protein
MVDISSENSTKKSSPLLDQDIYMINKSRDIW